MPCGGLLWRWTIEQTDSVFAVVATHLAELVEDQGSQFLGSFAVAGVDGFEIFPFRLLTHDDVTLLWRYAAQSLVGYIPNESTIPPWVTF